MTDPTLDVAIDLRAILALSADLEEQAVHKATAREMPGGDAMVMLGPVASPAAWERRLELVEAAWFDSDEITPRPNMGADEDPSWEATLSTLLFWSEVPHPNDKPTIRTEAEWLLENLRWMYDHEPHFADFAKDIAAARRRLEAVLYAGDRDEKSWVPCTTCDLDRDGNPLVVRLIREYGTTVEADRWTCPRCKLRYDTPSYLLAQATHLERHASLGRGGTQDAESASSQRQLEA